MGIVFALLESDRTTDVAYPLASARGYVSSFVVEDRIVLRVFDQIDAMRAIATVDVALATPRNGLAVLRIVNPIPLTLGIFELLVAGKSYISHLVTPDCLTFGRERVVSERISLSDAPIFAVHEELGLLVLCYFASLLDCLLLCSVKGRGSLTALRLNCPSFYVRYYVLVFFTHLHLQYLSAGKSK